MKQVILLLGDFTFLNPQTDGKTETIINRIDRVMVCDDEDSASEIGEEQLEDGCESYLVPSSYLENKEASIIWDSIIDEDTHIVFDNYDQLFYEDAIDDKENVVLYIDGLEAGKMKVWCDSEMDDREYITVNHTILYLDTLNRFICGSCGEHVGSYTYDEDRDIDVCKKCK